ncbi:ATPase, T2SS/T4P/T4SS family [candidate division CSSED10-310 bacterium]|uniref:ATPase, T2SS/T4P/T4SS family n=1 Tax=candidate division CSSED10-310 bacterium TaxID=2855610 RepID=A0ABV6YW88_UNCC1
MAKQLCEFCVEKGLLTQSQQDSVQKRVASQDGAREDDVILDLGIVDELTLAQAKAEFYKVTFIDLIETATDSEAALIVPEKFARKNICIPYKSEKGILSLAMYNPRDFAIVQDVEFTSGLRVEVQVATRTAIEKAINTAYRVSDTINDVMQNITMDDDIEIGEEGDEEDLTDEEQMIQDAPVIKMVNMIIVDGVKKDASDIHIEPHEKFLQVRSRYDGWLRNSMQAPKWMQFPVISRLKIMASIDISEKRKPQDGKIRMKVEGRQIDLRVSTLPTRHGEKVVIRILDQSKSLVSLDKLGMSEKVQGQIYSAIQKPQGMILVTGPTGSGKTTSLYSFLATVRDEALNIVTIEDPIEYELKGINQVQINERAGLTFASALRSILRQDPNIVMVGEIRDHETAEIAVKASQTGHLVFSTLHTNDTVATITRLVDIGIEPFLISSSVIIIIAQRLVRKICPDCKKEYQPPDWVVHQLKLDRLKDMKYYHGEGCNNCAQSGYKGRIGVYEVLEMVPKLREKISAAASEEQVKQEAITQGTVMLITDAIQKIREGITTPEEVVKVIHVEELSSSAYCPRCEKPIQPEFKACPYCGQVLSLHCEKCQKKIEPTWAVCPYCGTASAKPEEVDVPVKDEPVPTRAQLPPDLKARGLTKPKVLIVDDEPKILLMVKATLKQIDCEVITANNGQEGLQMVEKHMPNLVISDINMPKMNGYEFCKAMRRNLMTAFIPFIMLTSRDTAEDKLIGFQQGTDDYMTKPFDYKELQARVQRLLARTYA